MCSWFWAYKLEPTNFPLSTPVTKPHKYTSICVHYHPEIVSNFPLNSLTQGIFKDIAWFSNTWELAKKIIIIIALSSHSVN
jgi:hypothetical protein